jgi:signal transduction histidine kinase
MFTAETVAREEERALRSTVFVLRQVLGFGSFLLFAGLYAAIDIEWVERVAIALVVFAAVGGLFALATWRHVTSTINIVRTMLATDVALVAVIAGQTPAPEDFIVAWVAAIAVASATLSPRGATLIAIESTALAIATPYAAGTDPDIAVLGAGVIVLASVAWTLITARRQALDMQARLVRSERQRTLAEGVASVGTWQVRSGSDEIRVSSEVTRLFDLVDASELQSTATWLGPLDEEDRARIRMLGARALETGEPFTLDVVVRPRGEEEPRVIEVRGQRTCDEHDATWLVGTAQDVTELRRVAHLREDFAAAASHELRTPATIVLGFARTLDDHWEQLDDAQRRSMLHELREGGERMSRLIEDVLSISRVERGELAMAPTTMRLAAFVRDALDELQQRRARLAVHDGAGDLVVLADPVRTRQIVFNLLDNAARYDSSGGEIVVRVARHASEQQLAQLCVIDHGPGVPEADRERIFDRFVRGRASRSAGEAQGTGLGLYLARSIARQQGGDLWVDDAPDGTGACFTCTLPIAPAR